LRAYPQIDPEKVVVVHNGIDLAAFQSAKNDSVVRELGIDPNQRSVLFVGRITQQKGLPYLLKAAKELPADVQLVLCAGAPDTKEIQEQVTALVEELTKTRSNVIWIERHLSRSELIAVLSSATVFACPSIYEPLGIVNLEAMACHIPVVATATGGIPEVVEDGKTGILVQIEQMQDGSGKPLDEAKFPAYINKLRRTLPYWLYAVHDADARQRLQRQMFWDNYKGSTDLLTRYVYPPLVWPLVRVLGRKFRRLVPQGRLGGARHRWFCRRSCAAAHEASAAGG
jgi:starch synthase